MYVKIILVCLRPEWRNRAYFIGTRLGCLTQITLDVKRLIAQSEAFPKRHHIDTCLKAAAASTEADGRILTEAEKVKAASDYFSCFQIAYKKARDAKRIGDAPLLDWKSRASSVGNIGSTASAWMKAQIDVYEAIIAQVVRLTDVDFDSRNFHPIADVGQSVHRGAVAIQGTIPSLSTSSRLYSYKLKRCSP